ncbi:MAG TPA: tetratricopeptide repeat protein [Terriglobales bacterium]|nr:tetratricopeptide repeat protein [Terriglobales bacterium]
MAKALEAIPVTRRTEPTYWSSSQVYTLAIVCLIAGLAIGYLFRGSESPSANVQEAAQSPSAVPAGMAMPPVPGVDVKPTEEVIDQAAEPLLTQAKQNPQDASAIVKVANLYYDAKFYSKAIAYYQQALKINPNNADVITDMGTAYFYSGNPDQALKEFDRSLKVRPNHAGTLFNVGIVRWQGKMDPKGAAQAWEKLLKTNPSYPQRQQVEAMIEKAKQHSKM